MNRYLYSAPEPELAEIKAGMTFTNKAGNWARVKARLSGNDWLVEFTDPNGKRNETRIPKRIMLKQMEECKKPDCVVQVNYE